ncbi:tetratricopeptide repeat protein [Candidatus Electronema sp. JC]|uniref:tetratricopeptide repeat protein n=1 Tax=Candidatus Electronema sp. JC TaxID=3401570 RepID=UPI003B43CDA4
MSNIVKTERRDFLCTFLLVSVFIFQIYSNTLSSSWHLDDNDNILQNTYIQINSLDLSSFANTLISGADWSAPKFYRPVSCVTFALNWYFGQDDPTGYHIVNISIHIIIAFFLYLVILQFMQIVDATQEKSPKHHFVALLGATLWAVAPIQTQAVTYIVQRMTSLAAMFTIFAIYSYLKARTEEKYIRWGVFCVLFFIAGIGSKENAIMLPASLLLLEFSFFRHHVSKQKIGWIVVASSAALLAGLLAAHFLLGKNLLNIFELSRLIDSYEDRSFTLNERILTEPRIILMYLSQIFFPLVSRLSLVHDIQLSTSIFAPWNTLPAIAIILALIVLSFIFLKKYPIFSFPILFFFLNHVVESTILPLEIVFEHRNYLPSFFLFVPVSFLIAQAIYTPNRLSFVGRFAIIAGTVCFLVISGHATYTRNLAWANEGTLWTDGIQKAPSSPRAAGFLGRWHQKNGKIKEAYFYFQKSLQNSHLAPTPEQSQLAALQALGEIHYTLDQYEQSLLYFDQCLALKKDNMYCLTNRAQSYIQLNLLQKALNDAEALVAKYPSYLFGKYLAASVSYQLGELTKSQQYMQEIIIKSLDKPKGLYLMGLILLKYKSYQNALFFLQKAVNLWPSNVEYWITLSAVYYFDNDYKRAEKILADIFDKHPISTIKDSINEIEKHDFHPLVINYIVNIINSHINIVFSSLE